MHFVLCGSVFACVCLCVVSQCVLFCYTTHMCVEPCVCVVPCVCLTESVCVCVLHMHVLENLCGCVLQCMCLLQSLFVYVYILQGVGLSVLCSFTVHGMRFNRV